MGEDQFEDKHESAHRLLSPTPEDDDLEVPRFSRSDAEQKRGQRWRPILTKVLFASSVLTNVLFVLFWISPPWQTGDVKNSQDNLSTYAKLPIDTDVVVDWHTGWTEGNETEMDSLWLDRTHIDLGMVALDQSYVTGLGIPLSYPFPWDKSKSLYILNGMHSMHCIQMLYTTIKEYRQGVAEEDHTLPFYHVVHCLEALRQDVKCAADDTPFYLSSDRPAPGNGQTRQCRDWSKLEEWAKRHTSCYQKGPPGTPLMDRFRYCEDDSPYLPQIRDHFGYDKDWLPSTA